MIRAESSRYMYTASDAKRDRENTLMEVLKVLRIPRTKLSNQELQRLLGLFHSMPFDSRSNVAEIKQSLRLMKLQAAAICRSETAKSISKFAELIALVKELQLTLESLLPKDHRGCK